MPQSFIVQSFLSFIPGKFARALVAVVTQNTEYVAPESPKSTKWRVSSHVSVLRASLGSINVARLCPKTLVLGGLGEILL